MTSSDLRRTWCSDNIL